MVLDPPPQVWHEVSPEEPMGHLILKCNRQIHPSKIKHKMDIFKVSQITQVILFIPTQTHMD